MRFKDYLRESVAYNDSEKYHCKVPEVKFINPMLIKRRDGFEVNGVPDEIALGMNFSEPIDVSLFRDGELICYDGHHRLAAAKQLGKKLIAVKLQSINGMGNKINELIRGQTAQSSS